MKIRFLFFLLLSLSSTASAQQLVRQIGRLQMWRGVNTRGQVYKPAGVAERVDPLCTDHWDQYAPMNRFCPVVDGDTCVTGCVAHAMAELMYFYKYPDRGTGSVTYVDSDGCGDTLTADFAQSRYRWDLMLDDYSGSYTDAEANAAARLLSDCGIAVRMTYGVDASGAQVAWQPKALADYFGYDRGMQLYYRNTLSQTEWDSIMFTELDAGRPLVMGAWSRSMGHSFICDGYDEQGYFHVRFGNPDGDADGWYYFTWLVPQQPLWHDENNPETGFNLLQCLLAGAQPASTDTPSAERHIFGLGAIAPLSDRPALVVRNLCNMGWNEHSGRVALALKPLSAPRVTSASDTRLLYTYDRTFLLEEFDDTTYTDTLATTNFEQAYAEVAAQTVGGAGALRIVPVYEDNGQFYEARTQMGTPNYVLVEQDAQGAWQLSVPEQATARLTLSDMSFPDIVVQGTCPAFTFSVSNEGAEYSGRIYFALVGDDSPLTSNIFLTHGLSILSGETLERDFSRTRVNLGVGTYHLRVMADVDLFTDSLVVLYEDVSHPIHVVKQSSTAILSPRADQADARNAQQAVYDLSGRRLKKETEAAGGIVVRQGHKYLLHK